MPAVLRFETNVPEVVKLKYATGKLTPSSMEGRQPDMLYTLTDGRQMYVPLKADDAIQSAGVRPYQPFEICKRKIGRENVWQIRVMDAGPVAAEPTPLSTSAARATNGNQHSNGNGSNAEAYSGGRGSGIELPAPPPLPPFPDEDEYSAPATAPGPQLVPAANLQRGATPQSQKLMGCFLAAIDAVSEAQAYATRKGLGITFTPENITSAALSCYINECKGGRA